MDAYFDMFSGISGNMVLGALLDLGLPLAELEGELEKLGLSGEYKIKVSKVVKEGIGGTHVEVELLDPEHHNTGEETVDQVDHDHQHSHQHEHGQCENCCGGDHHHHSDLESAHNHQYSHDHSHDHHQHTHQHGRNLNDINQIIEDSTLSQRVKEKSRDIFLNLARAEAKIHGTEIDKIHFHEVGAVDAIVDIVGSVIGLELLGVEKIYGSRIHTGTGFVHCDHGKMPVPAPATMELLQGVPVYSTGIERELVTPTGAAIITTLAEGYGPRPEMEISQTGYGAGSRDLEIPNLLRINLGQLAGVKKKS